VLHGKYFLHSHQSSIWSVECDGTLRAGIVGGPEFFFGEKVSDFSIVATEIAGAGTLIKINNETATNKIDPVLLPADGISKEPPAQRRSLDVKADRCDGRLNPVTKFGAPPPSTNGCGTGIFRYDYPPFKQAGCCVHHDYCWGMWAIFPLPSQQRGHCELAAEVLVGLTPSRRENR
jgi:hypothetical protein